MISENDPIDKELFNNDPEQAQLTTRAETDPLQDGGYGWVCVLCVFLINAHTWGINSVGRFRGLEKTIFNLLTFV